MKLQVNESLEATISTPNFNEIKKLAGPAIGISYQTNFGLHSGSFDNVPEEAFSANIPQRFSVVNSDGNMTIAGVSFNFF